MRCMNVGSMVKTLKTKTDHGCRAKDLSKNASQHPVVPAFGLLLPSVRSSGGKSLRNGPLFDGWPPSCKPIRTKCAGRVEKRYAASLARPKHSMGLE